MMRGVTGAAAAALLATASAGVAQAAVVLDLSENGCSGACFGKGVTSLGTVTVNAVDGDLDFTIDLTHGASFNANGNAQHNAFVFDLDRSGLTIGDLSAGFAQPTEKVGGATVIKPGPFSEASFGDKWNYAIDYVGGAKQGRTPDTLSFVVSDAAHDLTVRDIAAGDLYSGAIKLYAAADVYANGTTGNVGALQLPTSGVPEPATWAMLIFGIGMIGGALRRRARNTPALDAPG